MELLGHFCSNVFLVVGNKFQSFGRVVILRKNIYVALSFRLLYLFEILYSLYYGHDIISPVEASYWELTVYQE